MPVEPLTKRTFILSVVFCLPDLSALVTVPTTSIVPLPPPQRPDICIESAFVAVLVIVGVCTICPAPLPDVMITKKSSLSPPLTHFKPAPATAVALPLATVALTDVLKRPDGFMFPLLFVFLIAAYPRGVRSVLFSPSFISGRVLTIGLVNAPLPSVVEPKRVTLKLKLLVTAVTLALCAAPLFENSTMSPILN